MQEFIDALKNIYDVDDIVMTDEFKKHENWDSLTRLSLIAEIEDRFGVLVNAQDLDGIDTFSDLYNLSQKKVKKS